MTTLTTARRREVACALQGLLQGEVRFDPYTRALYSTDASLYQMEPIGVVFPRTREDLVATVRFAWENGLPLLPRGAGTSLAGQAVNHALVVDCSRYLNRLLEVNPEEGWARVEPGLVVAELNHALRPYGLRYAPDPSTANRATVGGTIGNNSCGAHSLVYGKTVDQVLEVEVVLADGTAARFGPVPRERLEDIYRRPGLEGRIYREAVRIAQQEREEILARFPRLRRRVSGYNLDLLLGPSINLAQLVVGSEGTLALVSEAVVRLVRPPRSTGLAVLHFRGLLEAVEAVPLLLEEGPTALEVVDGYILGEARRNPRLSRRMGFLEGEPDALLLLEVAGESEAEVMARLERVRERCRRGRLGYATVCLTSPEDQEAVWAVRRGGLGLVMGIRGRMRPLPFVEDTAVEPSRLPDYIARFLELLQAHRVRAVFYGHAGDGCMHIRPFLDPHSPEGLEKMVRIAEGVSDLVLAFGGSLSGEHGDGIVRGVWTEKMFGPRLYRAFREVKRAFDPNGIMNPGKIVDCPPMTENLRPPASPLPTFLDFSDYHGIGAAVDQCTGIGACRKTLSGTMCPSYMVTREEEHSTRGRANALRAVLSGLLPATEFTSHRLYQVLDLCLECKACKTECESGVDMARLKAEFLAHYGRAHGYPLRSRLFAHIQALNRLGCALAPLSNWLARGPWARLALSALGIHPGRRLPPFARPTFRAWFRRHRPSPRAGARGQVVLFDDTFTNYNYPQVGISATRLLEALGYEVVLAPHACCGRPMLSKGFVEEARECARRNLEALYPYVERGVPIVGCEPSCVLTIADDYPHLLGDERASRLAGHVLLIDRFLARLAEEGQLGVKFRPLEGKALFHGHCHQKALLGTEDALTALGLVPGLRVEGLDAGCCGMAGAFGFEKEHYEISMRIGARRLFPAVASLGPGDRVVVMGVSCRQQVEHGTGSRPQHLVEVLAEALVGE